MVRACKHIKLSSLARGFKGGPWRLLVLFPTEAAIRKALQGITFPTKLDIILLIELSRCLVWNRVNVDIALIFCSNGGYNSNG